MTPRGSFQRSPVGHLKQCFGVAKKNFGHFCKFWWHFSERRIISLSMDSFSQSILTLINFWALTVFNNWCLGFLIHLWHCNVCVAKKPRWNNYFCWTLFMKIAWTRVWHEKQNETNSLETHCYWFSALLCSWELILWLGWLLPIGSSPFLLIFKKIIL